MSRFNVKKVAVLGAGVMGAQIAAHLVNVKVPVVLFDLPAKEGPKNGIVTRAIEGLKKLKPSPLGVAEDASLIQPGQLRRSHGPAQGRVTSSSRPSPNAWTGSWICTNDRSFHRAARHRGVQHLGALDHEIERSTARASSRASAASTSSTRRATCSWWS
jgi:hypothetical protein